MTLESIVETTKQILRQSVTSKDKPAVQHQSLEVNLLQFLYELLLRGNTEKLTQLKIPLLSLLKDGLQLNVSPPTLFVLINIFNIFVTRVPAPEERRARKDLQVRSFFKRV